MNNLFLLVHLVFTLVISQNIILFHNRKAGGTTTLRWIKEFNLFFNNSLNIIHVEAYPFVHGLHAKNKNIIKSTMQKYKDNGLFIMTLRHPIDRILSQYDFEWKWGCLECNPRDDLPQFNLTYLNFMKTLRFNRRDPFKYKYANIALHDFMDRVERFEMKKKDLSKHRHELSFMPYSLYLSNYYLWFFCCDDMHCGINKDFDETQREKCFEEAKEMMDSMDIVLITEWISDIRTQMYFNKVIMEYVLNETYDDEQLDIIYPPKAFPHRLYLPFHVYNQMISNKDYKRLLNWNAMDIEFYKYAKRVSYDNIMTVVERL